MDSFFHFVTFYWHTVDLQGCDNFCCATKCFSHTYTTSFLSFGSSQNQFNPPGQVGKRSQDWQLQSMFAASPNLIAGHSPLLGSLFRENPQRNFSCPVSCHPLPLPPSPKFKLCGKVHRSPRGVGVSLRASTQAQTCSPCSQLSKAPFCPE